MIDIEEEYAQPIELFSDASSPDGHIYNQNQNQNHMHIPSQTYVDPSFHSHVINHATLLAEHDKKSQNLTMFYEPVSIFYFFWMNSIHFHAKSNHFIARME
jgi:hypothetical protein